MFDTRFKGPYAPFYWSLLFANGVVPQILWSKRMRYNLPVVWTISQVVSIGMWLERYVIIPVSIHRDFLPSSWGLYVPTVWDWGMFLGTIGQFLFFMFLFIRFLPIINIFEMKDLLHRMRHKHGTDGDGHASTDHDTNGTTPHVLRPTEGVASGE
jgi:molybdopterin-containing oxidoreductase family membrane subunit